MGLTLHYSLHHPSLPTLRAARPLLTGLQKRAATFPFDSVSKLLSWHHEKDDPLLAIMHTHYAPGPHPGSMLETMPAELLFFVVSHPGAEPARFGLARYQPTATLLFSDPDLPPPPGLDLDAEYPSNLPGLHWQTFCKTQYASLTEHGGFDNFFTIHDGLCQLLDHAATLGLHPEVTDESEYFTHRDKEKLRAEIHRWNTLVAAVAGAVKDHYPNDSDALQSPITADPTFEQLEAEGQHFLRRTPAKRPRRDSAN